MQYTGEYETGCKSSLYCCFKAWSSALYSCTRGSDLTRKAGKMALFQLHFFADSIKKITNVTVFLPNDLQPWEVVGYDAYLRPMKTLYLLHGYAGSAVDWVAGGLAQAASPWEVMERCIWESTIRIHTVPL